MKFKIEIDGDIADIMRDERRAMGLALTIGTISAANSLKSLWRQQALSAGLGQGNANSVRVKSFPKTGFSYSPAAEVHVGPDDVFEAFDKGATIRAISGAYLAIPTSAAGKSVRGGRISPAEWQRRTGRKLRLVVTGGARRRLYLVADDSRISKKSGVAVSHGGRRRKDGILTGAQTVVIFTLVRQVTLRKRLDLDGAVRQIANAFPVMVERAWKTPR